MAGHKLAVMTQRVAMGGGVNHLCMAIVIITPHTPAELSFDKICTPGYYQCVMGMAETF